MSNSKKYFFSTILLSLVSLSLVASFNYSVDPKYVYNVRSHNIFHHDERSQNPGLARNIKYNTAIIGTSHTQNTRSSYVNKVMAVKSLKLSMADSTGFEQHKLLNIILKNKDLKTIIWGLDYFTFLGDSESTSTGGEFPLYLYDLDIKTAVKYLLSINTLRDSVKALLGKGIYGIDQRNIWNDNNDFGEKKVLYAWNNECHHPRTNLRIKLAQNNSLKNNVYKNITEIIEAHPKVQFKLFLPPYSSAYHLFLLQYSPKLFSKQLKFRDILEKLNDKYSNVELYDFQLIEQTNDFDLYLDLTHYNVSINQLLIDYMHKKEYLVIKGTSTAKKFNSFITKSNLKLPLINDKCTTKK